MFPPDQFVSCCIVEPAVTGGSVAAAGWRDWGTVANYLLGNVRDADTPPPASSCRVAGTCRDSGGCDRLLCLRSSFFVAVQNCSPTDRPSMIMNSALVSVQGDLKIREEACSLVIQHFCL